MQQDIQEEEPKRRPCKHCGEDKYLSEFAAAACRCCMECEDKISKQCTACGEPKALPLFPLRVDSLYGRSRICRACKRHGVTAHIRTCAGDNCTTMIPAAGNLKYCAPCKAKAIQSYNINPFPPCTLNRKSYSMKGLMAQLLKSPWLNLKQES